MSDEMAVQFKARPTRRQPEALGNPYRYIARQLRLTIEDMLLAGFADAPAPCVLDYGAADSPYRDALPQAREWVAADLSGNPHAQMQLNPDGSVPSPDGRFDLVVSTQVLEHVADPALYLAECFRVLRPGGTLLLSTHGMMVWHPDPHDYWRWTSEGLRVVVEQAGFEVNDFRGAMGLAACGIQLFQDATHGRVWRRLRRPYAALMQLLVRLADHWIDKDSRERNALVYVLRAHKPNERGAEPQEHKI